MNPLSNKDCTCKDYICNEDSGRVYNPLSSISYTNKDFNAIYVELLDLVKKLTYKWDPSISNESDPGVILLKLNAIIGDKNNYNIDKNILEAFPETLTQDISARSLYKQLGYRMPWYRAATTKIAFKWVGKDSYELTDMSEPVTIPKFQMITDSNEEFIYTTTQSFTFSKHHKVCEVPAIEGILNTLTLNGRSVVELSDLDYNNRLYFNDFNIAENGLFIYNDGGSDTDYWTMVDNLQVEPLGRKNFEFGIDSRKNLCYIEFPSDMHNLIGTGLVIKYIVTNGASGNIISRTLDRFHEDVTVTVNGESVPLNDEVVIVTNPSAAKKGYDPEDIDSAYKNYRKVAGTFDTLVTVRDYMNAVYNSGFVSNAIVCDRLNDVQSSYIVTVDDDINNCEVIKFSSHQGADYIGFSKVSLAYDSKPNWEANKFFKYENGVFSVASQSEYNSSWQDCYYKVDEIKDDLGAFDLRMYLLHSPGNVSSLEDYDSTFEVEDDEGVINQIKSYIEDEKSIQHDFKDIIPDVPFMFKNKYPLDIRIIPHYKLTDAQISELKVNINKALIKLLNSSRLNFGEEPDYNIIYDCIFNSDERIKTLILDEFTYTTFATFLDSDRNEFVDIPISDFDSPHIKKASSVPKEYNDDGMNYYFVNGMLYKVHEDGSKSDYSSKFSQFRYNTIAKSILAGRTPLFDRDNDFVYSVDQNIKALEATDRLSTELTIKPFGGVQTLTSGSIANSASYKLKPNENLRFLAPSLVDETTYSNYVKFELVLNSGSLVTQTRVLSYNEYKGNTEEYRRIPITIIDEKGNIITEVKLGFSPTMTDKHVNDLVYNPAVLQDDNGEEIPNDGSRTVPLGERIVTLYDVDGNIPVLYSFKEPSTGDRLNYSLAKEIIPDTATEVTEGIKCENLRFDTLGFLEDNILYYKNNNETSGWFRYLRRGFTQAWEEGNITVKALYLPEDIVQELDKYKWRQEQLTVSYIDSSYQIPADCDYQLKKDEYITFFYKTTDDDEAAYEYKKYTEGKIIKPSFVLRGVEKHNAKVDMSNLPAEGVISYDELPSSKYQQIYSMYNQNDLSGSKTITIRKLNEVGRKKDEYYYYFITNNLDADHENYILTTDSNGEYILDNDEYFIYTNKEKTEFEMLGAGTLLKFQNLISESTETTPAVTEPRGRETLTVPAIGIDKITSTGLNAFMDSCKLLHCYMTVREQQMYNFSEGDVVSWSPDITTTIALRDKSGYSVSCPVYTTEEYRKLEHFDVSYRHDKEVHNLPKLDLSTDETLWRVKAILNINSSYDVAQEITQNDVYSSKKISFNDKEFTPEGNNLYLMSEVALHKVGGLNVDITYTSLEEGIVKPKLLVFELAELDEDIMVKNDDGSITIHLDSLTEDTLDISDSEVLEGHNYIMCLKNDSDVQMKLWSRIGNGNSTSELFSPINADTSEGIFGRGKYYFMIPQNSTGLWIELSSNNPKDGDKVTILPLCKYIPRTLFQELYNISESDIYSCIRKLDIDSEFDYIHAVPSEKLIEDPLVPKSFFNPSHIYNKFVLPMADLHQENEKNPKGRPTRVILINNR